ncbi:short-chain dehydrogenase [Pseudomonas chlororaphis]|uniref:Short-chain dehydrogenase n=4 Tax=Gammaproteobacteria TaxID=1236 RepID=A0A0D5Y418_9PSED|nr:short-chain dehydrogenase [Pseudomonas chlororaphis]
MIDLALPARKVCRRGEWASIQWRDGGSGAFITAVHEGATGALIVLPRRVHLSLDWPHPIHPFHRGHHMSMTFSGQVVLVTGAAAGIGRATALAFAAQGLKVVAADLDAAGGEGTVQLIRDAGGEALFVRCDVTDEADVQHLMAQVVSNYGRLDYAFNNAGIEIEKGKLADGTLDEFDAIMGVNVKGVWLCMKHQLPLLLAQGGGAIVNTASVAGLGAAPKMSIYAASKHAVIGLTKSAAIEYAKKKIRVNAVCPAVIDTDMFRRAYEADPRKAEFAAAMHPVGRIGKVEEIASAVLYLCSDGAAFTTGHALAVDGGATAI